MITSHCGGTSRRRRIVPPGPLPVQYPISSCPFFSAADGTAATAGGGAGSFDTPDAGEGVAGQGVAGFCSSRGFGKLYGSPPLAYQLISATLATCQALLRAYTTDAGPAGRLLRSFVSSGSWSVYRVAGLSPPQPRSSAFSTVGHFHRGITFSPSGSG